MFNIVKDSNGDKRILLGDDMTLGWVNDRVVGLRGLPTEAAAREAATVAWRAMDAVLAERHPGWLHRDPGPDPMRITHDGAFEWFYQGAVPIARLLRPRRWSFHPTFGIELVLPADATEETGVAVAGTVARAVVPLIVGPAAAHPHGTRYARALGIATA
jgi:hypothetical protein